MSDWTGTGTAIGLSENVSRLALMCGASTAPLLSNAEVVSLLALAALPDADDLVSGDTGWIPTYNLNVAAAEGWRWKAGRVSSAIDFGADGAEFKRSQLFKHCNDMAAMYEKQAAGPGVAGLVGSPAVGGSVTWADIGLDVDYYAEP